MDSNAHTWLKKYPWLQDDPARLEVNLGIEKEGLRVTSEGQIAPNRHPERLGSTLTHPYITTDYSEALLEFITPVMHDVGEITSFVEQLHRFSLDNTPNEWIWPASMPCRIERELDVPIAEYGTSNPGLLKHVYRRGLWHRYGRIMQCIAGVHFNFSVGSSFWPNLGAEALKDAQTQDYFAAIRNFRRYSWLLMYLFGASPCVDRSFIEAYPAKKDELEQLDANTLFKPYATSLRMSGMGYQSDAQASLFVCYNRLETYLSTLKAAIQTSYEPYEIIGLKDSQGQFNQMSTNILQIENEYYSDIRPKRTTHSGEKPIHALFSRGVEYVEVRSLDLNPYAPSGLTEEQMHFLEVFMLYCLLKDSPEMGTRECTDAQKNLNLVVNEGRRPGLQLVNQNKKMSMVEWANHLLDEILQLARCLDKVHGTGSVKAEAVEKQRLPLQGSQYTLSWRVLNDTTAAGGFQSFGIQQSKRIAECFNLLTAEQQAHFEAIAKTSLEQQKALEAAPRIEFETFLRDYLAGF